MKIAIPVAEGKLCTHFGHCQQFGFVTLDANNNIAEVEMVTPPPHEPGVLPKWLAANQVNLILAGGMGHRAQNLLAEAGIKVIVGVQGDLTPEQAVKAYVSSELKTGENACSH
jgi:predicted Fe-Mo cluster-binding NifX family protein